METPIGLASSTLYGFSRSCKFSPDISRKTKSGRLADWNLSDVLIFLGGGSFERGTLSHCLQYERDLF